MIVYFNFKKGLDNELVKKEKGSLRIVMPSNKIRQAVSVQDGRRKVQHELNIPSFKKQNRVLGLSIVTITITLITFCYTAWKDQRNTNPGDLFKDATAKELILNQMVQAH